MDDAPDASELNGKPESRADSNQQTSTSGRGPRTLPDTSPANGGSAALHSETLAPRSALPPLLLTLGERPPEALQYLGTSFGLTLPLFHFWARSQYKPVYVRQTASDITGRIVHHVGLVTPSVSAIKPRTRPVKHLALALLHCASSHGQVCSTSGRFNLLTMHVCAIVLECCMLHGLPAP